MTDKRWKVAERRIAAMLGGTRVPITGRSRGSAPDIAHPTLSLEVKTRQVFPAWLREAMDQALASRTSADQLPAVVLHRVGDRYDDALVVVRIRDLIPAVTEGGIDDAA